MKRVMVLIVALFFSLAGIASCDPAAPVVEEVSQPVAVEDASPGAAGADETVKTAAGEEDVGETVEDKGPGIGVAVWAFLNTPLGISVVGAILAFLLGKVFTAKPKWKKLVLKYGPSLMQAVKTAEKNIADTTDNPGLAKLDAALKYVIELEPKLKGASDGDVKQALSAVHAAAESHGNLKKE